eukprot:GHVU01011473.1.p1 GENE.GHVU01011473.1~~GHVU01011473.1.p1  ORF type:complete len:334 (-),score=69.49 GHVU01011473.1:1166-2047(-)
MKEEPGEEEKKKSGEAATDGSSTAGPGGPHTDGDGDGGGCSGATPLGGGMSMSAPTTDNKSEIVNGSRPRGGKQPPSGSITESLSAKAKLCLSRMHTAGVYRQWVTYGISSYMKKPQAIIDAAIVPPELMRPNGRVDCVEVSVVDIVRFDAPKFFPRVEEGRPGFAAPRGIDYRTLEVFLSCLKPSSSSSSSTKPPAALKICFRVFTPLTDMTPLARVWFSDADKSALRIENDDELDEFGKLCNAEIQRHHSAAACRIVSSVHTLTLVLRGALDLLADRPRWTQWRARRAARG